MALFVGGHLGGGGVMGCMQSALPDLEIPVKLGNGCATRDLDGSGNDIH